MSLSCILTLILIYVILLISDILKEDATMLNTFHFEPLDSTRVERGTVQQSLLFQQGYFSVTILKLSPGAKIKKHTHHSNNEKYVFDTGEVDVCIKGGEHELENLTDKEMMVLSIKWA